MNPERDAVQPSQPDAAQQVSTAAPPPRGWPASAALLAQRDPAVALEIITAGLTRHPDASELLQLRQQARYRLMEQHPLQDPFRFLIYAELAGAEIGPVAAA